MRLQLLHPEVANRKCADCKKWIYRDNGERMIHAGALVPRPKGILTPCSTCPKVPAGADPDSRNAVDLSDKNWLAYRHYLESRATGSFPHDAIVRRNAAWIRMVEDEAAEIRALQQQALIKTLALARK